MSEDQVNPPQEIRDLYQRLIKTMPLQDEIKQPRDAVLAHETTLSKHVPFELSRPAEALDAEGNFVISMAFFFSTLSTNSPSIIVRENGQEVARLDFDGKAWGFGLGGGTFWATGWFVKPSAKKFEAEFVVIFAGAFTEVNFVKDGKHLGHFVGPGLGIGIGVMKGSGHFQSR